MRYVEYFQLFLRIITNSIWQVGAQAVDQGFAGTGDWEVSGANAGAFTAASNAAAAGGASWDAAEPSDWAAAPAAAGQEWAASATGEQW